MLQLIDISVHFGGLRALQDVSISLPGDPGISAIIGPNGAGKTTLFNVITGLVPPHQGKVVVQGRDMTNCRPDDIFRAGLARTFQGVRLFANLTLFQNLLLAASSIFAREEAVKNTEAALLQLGLDRPLWRRYPSELTQAQARFAEIARGLSSRPAALLLDEPGAGLNPTEKLALCDHLRAIAESYRCRVVLVEHDMKLVMSVSESIWVMNFGTVLAVGTPEEVQNDQAVIDAYLGERTGDED